MPDRIKAAVIGLGVGEQHVSALLTHPNVELIAICDLDNTKTESIAKKYHLSKNHIKSFSDILNDSDINMVSIASFDDDHFKQVMACLQKGKHVFVEKPLCQTKQQLKKIYQLWQEKKVALSSNLILRKSPLFMWLSDCITKNELGDIYAIDADYLYGRIHKITQGWRSQVEQYSVMAGGGIHMIDLMIRFIGQKPIHVQSHANKIATRCTPFRYADFHTATFTFENGAIGRVTANFGCMHKHQHVIKIFGTKATFIYDDMGARLYRTREEDAKAEFISLAHKPSHKGVLLLDFIDSILRNNYHQNAFVEFELMEAVLAADQAIFLQR